MFVSALSGLSLWVIVPIRTRVRSVDRPDLMICLLYLLLIFLIAASDCSWAFLLLLVPLGAQSHHFQTKTAASREEVDFKLIQPSRVRKQRLFGHLVVEVYFQTNFAGGWRSWNRHLWFFFLLYGHGSFLSLLASVNRGFSQWKFTEAGNGFWQTAGVSDVEIINHNRLLLSHWFQWKL